MEEELSSVGKEEAAQPENEAPQMPKQKFGLKIFTFLGGFFDVAVGGYIAYVIYTLLSNFHEFGSQGVAEGILAAIALPFIIVFYVVLGLGGALFVIFGLITLISSLKSDKKNWGGLVVATLVFDFLILFFGAFLLFMLQGEQTSLYVLFGCLVLAIVFKIADLIIIRHRNKKFFKEKQEYLEASGQTAVEQIDKVDFSKLGEPDLKNKK